MLCLIVAQHLLQFDSDTRRIHYADTHLRDMFPTLPEQSGYNKRVRAAGPLIVAVITTLARDILSWHELLRLVDSTQVPTGMSREPTKRSDLADDASFGYCASPLPRLLGIPTVCDRDSGMHAGALGIGEPEDWGAGSGKGSRRCSNGTIT